MIALMATAWALDCHEVRNMELAGVPHATIASEISRAGTPVDMEFMGCLFASGLDPELVKAAARVHQLRPGRDKHVRHEWPSTDLRRVRLAMDCGSVEWRASTDGQITVDGRAGVGDRLVSRIDKGQLSLSLGPTAALAIEEETTVEVGLPQFDTSGAPSPAPSRRPLERCADLVVHVPAQLAVSLETARADARFHGLSGPLQVVDHFGNVEVVGSNRELRIRTTGGDVYADTGATLLEVDTVSGQMVLGVGEEAHAVVSTISGGVWLYGGALKRLAVNAVSGDVNVFASFADGARADLVSHSGDITARVPRGRVDVSSHSGTVLGPERSAPAKPFESEGLGPAWARLWQESPTRWWFGSGAVLSGSQAASTGEFDLNARAFSGNVDVSTAGVFPTSSGPILQGLTAVQERLDACGTQQFARTGGSGHAVATFTVLDDGSLTRVSAPASAKNPDSVADGELSRCVVSALESLILDGQGTTRVRWPVRFGLPIEPLSNDATRSELRVLRRSPRP